MIAAQNVNTGGSARKFPLRQHGQYRVRVNRRWVNGDTTYTVTAVMRHLRSRLTESVYSRERNTCWWRKLEEDG